MGIEVYPQDQTKNFCILHYCLIYSPYIIKVVKAGYTLIQTFINQSSEAAEKIDKNRLYEHIFKITEYWDTFEIDQSRGPDICNIEREIIFYSG